MSVKHSKSGPYWFHRNDPQGNDIGPVLARLGIQYWTNGNSYGVIVPEPLRIDWSLDRSNNPVIINEHNQPLLEVCYPTR